MTQCSIIENTLTGENLFNKSSEDYYLYGNGKNIMNESNYPNAIKDFLYKEKECIKTVLNTKNYDYFYELGCADARNVDVVSNTEIKYRGVDILSDHIILGINKIHALNLHGQAELFLLSINDLIKTFKNNFEKKVIFFFPFNLFGNLENPTDIFMNLLSHKVDFFISMFNTNQMARDARNEYYLNCGIRPLFYQENNIGDTFYNKDGFKSISYNEKYINNLFTENVQIKSKLVVSSFSEISQYFYVKNEEINDEK